MATILIVDDSVTMMEGHKRILETQGHTVHHAENGEEGVARALELVPDLILMDVVMPKMNGFECCLRIKKNTNLARIPMIFLSGSHDEKDKEKFFKKMYLRLT